MVGETSARSTEQIIASSNGHLKYLLANLADMDNMLDVLHNQLTNILNIREEDRDRAKKRRER